MKNIIKTLALALLLVNVSCENDDQAIISGEGTAPELISPSADANYVLTADNADNDAVTFVWNHSEYGQQTAVNYELQFAQTGTDFASPVSGGTSANNQKFLTLTTTQLNTIAVDAGLAPFTAGKLDVRVKSSLGMNNNNEETVMYSNVVSINVTPFSTDLPRIYVVGNFQNASGYGSDWTPASGAPLAAATFTSTEFEGYVYMNVASPEFKIVPTTANFDGDYGDDGSFSGTLVQTGEVNMQLSAAGYYYIKANTGTTGTGALTYSVTPTTWGVVGAATPGGWDASTALTYNATNKTWEGDIPMTAGEFKFRANNAWDINLGGFQADKPGAGEVMSYGGANLVNDTAGTKHVVLDLSNPRAYKYTVTQ